LVSKNRTQLFLRQLRQTFSKIYQLPIPTISAVSSVAFGGGLELALCTDLRVFASTATVALPETRLGIVPGAGGTYRLPAIIGANRARDLILTGRRVAGPEAYFLGRANRLVEIPDEEAKEPGKARERTMVEALRTAMEICEGAPLAIRAAKRATKAHTPEMLFAERENQAYDDVVTTADRDEALVAFKEKRKPVFGGR
jgi:methylglutaconyl-CoA hydratase